jgi:pimeloyl-ACP methyl ester carboxylesterase
MAINGFSRRALLRGSAGCLAVLGASRGTDLAFAQGKPKPRTFVLVHGAWHGGWCWRRVADILEAKGHKVFTPTLTGLGERSHLLSGGVTLDTHITDIVNVFKWEDIEDAVLVGHSYAGFPVSGAVEKILSQVASIVYLDAFYPADGESVLDTLPEAGQKPWKDIVASGGVSRPPLKAELFKLTDPKDVAWVNAKMTPQPIGPYLQKIKLTGAAEKVPKKTYIRALDYPSPYFDKYLADRKADKSWKTIELQCSHEVMVEMPDRLADILMDVA